MRRWLVVLTVVLIVVTYPLAWALGYQDHPWHWHTAADIVTFVAAVMAMSLHALRNAVDPPLRRRVTGLAVVVTCAALASALFWDWVGRPSDADVTGGPGFILMSLAALAAALVVAALVVAAIRRRSTASVRRI